MVSPRRYLFVIGCARSGTTAMANLLNTSAGVCVTDERYTRLWYKDIDHCSRSLFEMGRLTNIRTTDSYISQSYIKDDLRAFRAKYRKAKFVGDKAPKLHAHLDKIRRKFPGARFIFMLRNIYDVSNSFEERADKKSWDSNRRTAAAIAEWNASLEHLAKSMRRDVFVVCYEEFFHAHRGLPELIKFLDGIPGDIKPKGIYAEAAVLGAKKRDHVDEAGRFLIATRARFDLYRQLLARWYACVGDAEAT